MDLARFKFSPDGKATLGEMDFGKDWPVVYLINNSRELYIGETCNASHRCAQHLNNPERRSLEHMSVLVDDQLNKSATLDIEQSLIQLCGADQKFRLQNKVAGQSSKHNYYQREMYVNKLPHIWQLLRDNDLAKSDYQELVNSDLFKYSPYISLNEEQREISNEVLTLALRALISELKGELVPDEDRIFFVNGSAGTGKTILAINMMSTLAGLNRIGVDVSEDVSEFTDEELDIHTIRTLYNEFIGLKAEKTGLNPGDCTLDVALVVPMQSIRRTLRKVFGEIGNGLSASMVISPNDLKDRRFDMVLVDESHRLARRKNIPNYKSFDDVNRDLGLPGDGTQLDWVLRQAFCKVLFYDVAQSVKGSDVPAERFEEVSKGANRYYLSTQMRCDAGDSYADYLRSIFDCDSDGYLSMSRYDFRSFDDVDEMVNAIKRLNSEIGLCRNVAGYSWPWSTKGKRKSEILESGMSDIHIGPYSYVWNMSNVEWILRDDSIDEIGCIHTTQGYDLNYVGVIFGEEIDYDESTNRIVIDRDRFHDRNVKNSTDDPTLRRYIINSYRTMMMRGIKGCYVYACNPGMASYLKRFTRPVN